MRMKMKTLLALLAALLCLTSGALAGCAFPDLEAVLGMPYELYAQNYAFSEDFTCDAYLWDYPVGWDGEDEALARYVQKKADWAYQPTTVEGHEAWLFTSPEGENAILVSRFQGRLLGLLPVGCEIVGTKPTQAPNRPQNTPQPSGGSGGHWEWQMREKRCPAGCMGGRCTVCNGSGVYRMYGETVWCSPICPSCDGLGVIYQRDYVFVPD